MLTLFQRITVAMVLMLSVVTAVNAVEQVLGIDNLTRTDVLRVEGNTIILGTGCRAITADTTQERADSIRLGMQKTISLRPNTHDTFVQALKTFNITVDSLRLIRHDGTLYYADLILRSPDKVLKLDVMPSDGIAIAIRADAPLYVNTTLLAERGENIC